MQAPWGSPGVHEENDDEDYYDEEDDMNDQYNPAPAGGA